MSTTISVRFTVNGVDHELVVEPRLLLVHALRDHLGRRAPTWAAGLA
jgi:aerobic-type carbon monoxide dehydrogenase small subunit (CoxS/CutS family)